MKKFIAIFLTVIMIFAFAKNETLQQQIVSYLQSHDYGNENEINKL